MIAKRTLHWRSSANSTMAVKMGEIDNYKFTQWLEEGTNLVKEIGRACPPQ